MRIGLLGPVEVVAGADGAVVGLGGQRLRAVLARLALDPDRVVTVDALVDAVWGDDPPAGSVNALQSLVSRLRRALPAGTVLSVPAGYRLAVDPESVDACRFERLAAAGRRALADDDPARAADELREALALWRGPALADIGEAPFRAAVAVRLENTRLAALEDRIDADLTLGRHADVIPELEALTAANPLRERPFALLMLALNGASQQAEALATYDRIRRRLADELGMDPGPVLVAAQASVLNGQPAGPSRPSSNGRQLPAPRSNLRPQLTSFVGRADELDRIAALLRDERLVTLVGPGGAGKTRLAEESGSRLTGTHSGGVWMIPLAPVGDGGELDQALLTSLGRLSFTQLERSRTLELGPPDLHEKVVKALSSGPTLLVLDNCEHLIESIAELAHELLLDCPQLRILATSREPLGVPGERLHPVPSLEVPPANVTSPADALHFSAVQLLVDRAVAVRPEFKLDEQNVRAVVDICHRLDGMPLALELAAARFRSLGPEQVAARLGDRFRLLTGGSRTVLPRHQTLRAVVAWSWELLKPAEQALWRRLSVFPAGVSLDAAEQVCADVELGPEEMLDTLASLVDKSLVELAGDDANPRYRMLETMRAYGAERLTEAGETERLRDTQMAYYLELVETNEPKLRTSEQGAWIAQLTIDYENIIAALRWAIDTQRADPAIRIIGGLTWYLSLRGAHREALRWASAALAMPGESSPVAHAIVRAFAALGEVSMAGSGGFEAARAAAEDAAREVQPFTADPDSHPVLVLADAITAFFTDQDERVRPAIRRAEKHNDPWVRALAVFLEASMIENDGDASRAEALFTQAKDAFTALGDSWGRSGTLSSLAGVRALRNDHSGAIKALEEAYQLTTEIDASEDHPRLLIWLALEWARVGEIDRARSYLTEASARIEEMGGDESARGFFSAAESTVYRLTGDLERAERVASAAIEAYEAAPFGPPQVKSLILSDYCFLLIERPDAEPARGAAIESVQIAQDSHDSPVLGGALEASAAVALRLGDASGAALLLGAATRIRGIADEGNPDVLGTIGKAKALLGADAYDARYAEGLALAREEIPSRAQELLRAAHI